MSVINQNFTNKENDQPHPEGLIGVGPIVQLTISIPTVLSQILAKEGRPISTPINGFALIDTGATKSAIDESVVKKLKLKTIGTVNSKTAGGEVQLNLYPATFIFPQINFNVDFSSVTGVKLKNYKFGENNVIALIGRDFLSRCIFVYNGTTGSYSIAL